jgi:hypothetical protein
VAHARGVSAILMSKSSPFNLVCGGKLFDVVSSSKLGDFELASHGLEHLQPTPANKVSPIFSVLCTPLNCQSKPSNLDVIFTQTASLSLRATVLLASDASIDSIYSLKLDAEQLIERYDSWPESLPKEWWPRTVGVIDSKDKEITYVPL